MSRRRWNVRPDYLYTDNKPKYWAKNGTISTSLGSANARDILIYCQSEFDLSYLPQEPVNAVPSILNFGSPKPPVDTEPLGLVTCCNADSAMMKESIKLRTVVSSPRAYLQR